MSVDFNRVSSGLAFALLLMLLAVATTGASGCTSAEASREAISGFGETELYNRAQLRMRGGNFGGAVEIFRVLLRRYPFGRYSEQAQIELVYAHFMSYRVELAQLEAARFLRLYPQHQNADYARFIHAYSLFYRDDSVSSKAFRLNYSRRDVSKIRESFESLSEFLQLHPESPYAPLARRRMLLLKEWMSFSELWVAQFYLQRGAFLAAVNRASWVLTHIPDTSATPWALAIMSRGYSRMEMEQESEQSLAVLRESFPEHEAWEEGELQAKIELPNDERSITSILTLGLFDAPADIPQHDAVPPPPPLLPDASAALPSPIPALAP